MERQRILVVEDEEDILELVRFNLAKEGYRVEGLTSGEAALRATRTNLPHLLILDLMLPGMDGLELCRMLRAEPDTRRMPIIMLTAKGEEADVVAGLELGADDYIPKPFSPRVLLARVKAVLRRDEPTDNDDDRGLEVHGIRIHPGRREITVDGEPVDLTFTEFNIMLFLARRPGWVFTRGQIMDAVRGEDYHVTERSVDVQMVSLRKKLGDAGRHLQTVRGVGYRMAE